MSSKELKSDLNNRRTEKIFSVNPKKGGIPAIDIKFIRKIVLYCEGLFSKYNEFKDLIRKFIMG